MRVKLVTIQSMCDTCGNPAHLAEDSENKEPETTPETPSTETPSTEGGSEEGQVS